MNDVPPSDADLPAPRPPGVRIEDEAGIRMIAYRWFSPIHVLMLAFCVFWDGFLVFWYRSALSAASPNSAMIWFPLLHVAVGIGLTYATIAGFVNRTEIRVGQGRVSIWHGPLPWLGIKTVPSSDIRQVYREETFGGRSRTPSWHLSALTPGNRSLRLVRNVNSPELALFLESEIERMLGIRDQHVPGEMSK
jgi:hypothetical protein